MSHDVIVILNVSVPVAFCMYPVSCQCVIIVQEVVRFQNLLIDQTSRTVSRNLSKFLAEDIKQMKETKGYFNKISNDLDSALNKNAAVNKSHPAALDDASNLLTATRWVLTNFTPTALLSVFVRKIIICRRRHVVSQ